MKLKEEVNKVIKAAFDKAGIDAEPISVSEATKPEFGDYQFNGAMALSKKLRKNPREIASEIMGHLDFSGIVAKAEIAGPGFINLWLNDTWVAQACEKARADERLGIEKTSNPIKVVVDYSGPNMAKQMHVGHLRSTIIGDTLANLLEFLGDEVIRQNHIGDWGTQFGMLIAYLEERGEDGSGSLKDLEQFYKDAKKRFDEDEAFADKAREYVVKIQSGDEHCLNLWQKFIDISLGHCEEVYDKLCVRLTREDVKAESFYNEDLPEVVADLAKEGRLRESEGAQCVFFEEDEIPVIVQKGDGGYLYATTDLAALRYRANILGAKRISYVVDARQGEHFKQIFKVAKMSGFVPEDVKLEHVAFGTMMDKGGKPFKTRDGGTVKLIDLLDEAVVKAKAAIKEKDDYSEEEVEKLAKTIGIGAVKYADLSINRESNYIFNWDKMLSFEGNTSLYMQYAYARIQSIFRRYGGEIKGDIVITDVLEHRLSVMLLRFEEVLERAAEDAAPNQITTYLYELVTLFMRFYEQNPILKEGVDEATKQSRLALADMTAKTIKQGLDILGIEVVDKL
ncbi:arginyl-tRNA synthetase [Sulfurovum lithotrophicum]|uniref:Arginine--tRNA ligase n=1 Tax=Sulfurovum lithotrophicum TaxID=206403 RepID=A0A7U4RPW5_9BACT|nr:arginine--tRNA ligase [Sulfurovum lithotrophicum]AKF24066.1 arginyl-tRNA synthetase [Sulfurovum lithotrophicum]